MIAASVAKVWELALILPELKSCIIQFTHTKQRGTFFNNRTAQQIATGNWWGAATGPNTPGADTVDENEDAASTYTCRWC